MRPRAAAGASALLLAATLALELWGAHAGHGGGWWHALPGFDFLYGLVGCAGIVIVAKALGRIGLQKPDSPGGPGEGAS